MLTEHQFSNTVTVIHSNCSLKDICSEVSFKGVICHLFSFSLVCYVAVCACIIYSELQSSKFPTKGFILSKREG